MDLMWVMICLYGFPITLLAIAGIISAWIIWEKWMTPQESKTIRKATRKKRPIAIHVGDEGFAKIEILDFIGKEGFASTKKDSTDKDQFLGFFARSPSEEPSDKKGKIAAFINKLASKKVYLQHAKIPVWFAYTGKAILTSLFSLAGLELTKDLPTNPTPAVVDLQELKSLFGKPWDQTQIRANQVDARTEGVFEGKKFSSLETWKAVVVPVGIILALVIGVMVIAIVFFR